MFMSENSPYVRTSWASSYTFFSFPFRLELQGFKGFKLHDHIPKHPLKMGTHDQVVISGIRVEVMYVYCSEVAFLKFPKSNKIAPKWLIPTGWDADALSGATTAVLNPYAKAYVPVSLVATSKTDETYCV